jgi:hypothetical protein
LRRLAELEGIEVKISQAVLVSKVQQNMFEFAGTSDLFFNKEIFQMTVEETHSELRQFHI